MDENELLRKSAEKKGTSDLQEALQLLAESEEAFNGVIDTYTIAEVKAIEESFSRAHLDRDLMANLDEVIEEYRDAGSPHGDTFGDLVKWCDEQNEQTEQELLDDEDDPEAE